MTNLVASITQPGCNCGYGYDDNGNIASATLNGKWTGYTYDELGQLIQVNDHSDTRSGENGTTWKYTYDLGGNILKKERFAYATIRRILWKPLPTNYGDANWRDKLTAVNGSTIALRCDWQSAERRNVDVHLAERPAAAKDAEVRA